MNATAKYFKKAEWIEDYKLQTAAYAIAHNWMFPEHDIQQAVLLLGTRPSGPPFNQPPKCQIVVIPPSELELWKDRWVDVLEEFYANR